MVEVRRRLGRAGLTEEVVKDVVEMEEVVEEEVEVVEEVVEEEVGGGE